MEEMLIIMSKLVKTHKKKGIANHQNKLKIQS